MNEKKNRTTITLTQNDEIVVDTCSLIEGNRYPSMFQKLKCFIVPQAHRELASVLRKKLNLAFTPNSIDTKTLEITPEIATEAKKLYDKYGLMWGVSRIDCLFLASAKINKVPLMTCDRALLNVAKKEDVKVIPMFLHGKQGISIIISKTVCENVSFKDLIPKTKLEDKADDGRV
jgi:predicted nucleic acid-binding protein